MMKEAVRVQLDDFSQDEEIRALQAGSGRVGGIATFLGCARDFSAGRAVSELSFDAYEPHGAWREMQRLRDEAIERFGLIDARIVHRLGVVQGGRQRSSSSPPAPNTAPRRSQACRWLIDRT
jgi:molybdopterin synthase catalytic subunit